MGKNDDDKGGWCFLIDFGLARRFTLPNGDIRTARDSAGFRGTARCEIDHSHPDIEYAPQICLDQLTPLQGARAERRHVVLL